jgi:D-alanyl-D-alanine carboxypeptidase
MGKQNAPTRSFNTVKHSNRDKRVKRKQNQRIVLLSIFLVVILLVLALAAFGVCLLVDLFKHPEPPVTVDPSQNEEPAPEQPSDVVYTALSQLNSKLNAGELIIVNKDHSYDPAQAHDLQIMHGSQPKNQSGFYVYSLANTSYKLNATALSALNLMLKTYHEVSDGDMNIKVGSAYRTAAEQESYATPVGQSDHHSGYCFTLKDGNAYLDANHWIYENCHKYGFVVRYPEGKEAFTGVSDYNWCFRYVGVAHATYMKQNNLCMEEYVTLLKQNYASGAHLTINGADGNQYEVYYTAASTSDTLTTLQVPKNFEYAISGDNMGGFIVTVNRSKPVATDAN